MTVPGKFLEEPLEPRDGLGVEVVRRLVEQQHVGIRQQQAAQRDAAALAARQRLHARVPRRQAQRIGGDLELALELPAAGGVDGFLQLALLLEQLVHLVVFERLGELVADLVEALDELQLIRDAFLDDGAHVLGGIERGLLRQETDLDAGLRPRLAFELRVDAGHDLAAASTCPSRSRRARRSWRRGKSSG